MSKTSGIVAFLEAGIRAENLRQKAIANNVANLHTPGYRRIAVKFEELLAKGLKISAKRQSPITLPISILRDTAGLPLSSKSYSPRR
jgi:flagellar basal-body rod protein FlgB